MTLTKEDVLRAVAAAVAPWSNYIGQEVQTAHRKAIEAGGRGHAPRVSLILRRLNQLAEEGLLLKSTFTNGYYGYRWDLTPAGHAALKESK